MKYEDDCRDCDCEETEPLEVIPMLNYHIMTTITTVAFAIMSFFLGYLYGHYDGIHEGQSWGYDKAVAYMTRNHEPLQKDCHVQVTPFKGIVVSMNQNGGFNEEERKSRPYFDMTVVHDLIGKVSIDLNGCPGIDFSVTK